MMKGRIFCGGLMAGPIVQKSKGLFSPGAPQIGVKPPQFFVDIFGGGDYGPYGRRSGGDYRRSRSERSRDRPERNRDGTRSPFNERQGGQDRFNSSYDGWGSPRNEQVNQEEAPAPEKKPREKRSEGKYRLTTQKHPEFNVHMEVSRGGNETLIISRKDGAGEERRFALEEGHMLMAAVPGAPGEGNAIFVVTEKFNEVAGASYSLYRIEARGKRMENIGYSSGRIPEHWLNRSLQPSGERKITEFTLPGDRQR